MDEKIVNCELCGTKCRVVGKTTLHYEPVVEECEAWPKKENFTDYFNPTGADCSSIGNASKKHVQAWNTAIDACRLAHLKEKQRWMGMIKEALDKMPSTKIPISLINEKHYFYMNKEEILEAIRKHLED